MTPTLASSFRATFWIIGGLGAIWAIAFGAFTTPFIQKHALYAHKLHTGYFEDISKPQRWGFAKNQVTPFNFSTPDNETLYAWHIMPLGLYAQHDAAMRAQPSGIAEDITKTKAFKLLTEDPQARLIISFHGNAGSVAQGWRPDIYRSLSDGSTSSIHILAPDYRGFGYSTGSPSESGLIMDGIATVNWALNVAKIPSDRIVIIGHSLGTAVTAATVEHFAKEGVSFAGVIVIAPFSDLPTLLTRYAPGGLIPLLHPIEWFKGIHERFPSWIHDKWPSAERLANFVKIGGRVRLFIIHARDDYEIPYTHSDTIFAAVANATTPGVDVEVFEAMKQKTTVDLGDGASISTWKTEGKLIQEIIVSYGGK